MPAEKNMSDLPNLQAAEETLPERTGEFPAGCESLSGGRINPGQPGRDYPGIPLATMSAAQLATQFGPQAG
jgi:hypothetical protein